MNNKNNRDSGNLVVLMAVSCIFVILIVGITLLVGLHYNSDKRGTFGDMFGFANALFTGLSFIGLIGTILLQRKDLNIQRDELKKQSHSIHVQNFENTFFQMISLFNSIINNAKIRYNGNHYEGREAYNKIAELIFAKSKSDAIVSEGPTEKNMQNYTIKQILAYYDDIYETYKSELGHYYRTFYHIVKLIHNTPDINKRQYISIARAQLSSHELLLFLYNGLHENGSEKFKPLIEEYTLFNNLDESLLINTKPINQYSLTAFKYPDEINKAP